jgi:cellulose synthase/poly-beta-1,6-N-acetylglucosamine synthase-like glycosyltransferase
VTSSLALLLCTLDRPTLAARAVHDVLNQGCSVLSEVIVVDQSGDADAHKLAAQLYALGDSRIRLFRAKRAGLPRARNVALDLASADQVVFVDDDVRLLPGFLDAHHHQLLQDRVGVVSGRIVERQARPNHSRTCNRVGRDGRVHTNLAGLTSTDVQVAKGANMSFRRELLVLSGGFDARYGGSSLLEDADASARVRGRGWRVRFAADAELVHLSALTGGVRLDRVQQTAWWRFHNTALFVMSQYGAARTLRAQVTFAAIASKCAIQWREPGAFGRLMTAWGQGVAAGKSARLGYESGDASRYGRRA